ncbi:hypothetical protein SpCBS45565_g06243 [Spizellomyces sp. 'palustris']|nr:hypothetical protein SpCBS45565_g06243 [Spizellomyces sp. 'palustris']
MKLLVSPCFHKMCETCINRLFLQGPAPCPICKVILRKSNFVAQTFEDLYVEKEVQIRKRIGRVSVYFGLYNKRLEDFKGNLRAYNDYLEDVEEIMFNLINDVDVKETNERIKKYEQENKDLINANLQKQLIEEKAVHNRLDREKKEKQIRKEAYEQAIIEEAKVKLQAKEEIIKRLASEEDASAQSIIADAVAKRSKAPDITKFLQERLPTADEALIEAEPEDTTPFDPMDYTYQTTTYTAVRDVYVDPWLTHLRLNEPSRAEAAKASGFAPRFTYERAIGAAFSGVFAGL